MTIKNQQKINELLPNYAIKINSYIKNHQHDFSKEYFMACIIDADPNEQGEYSEWILNNVLNENILLEDVESGDESNVYKTLYEFNTINKSFIDKNLIDIKNNTTLDKLSQKTKDFKSINDESFNQEQKEQIYKDTIFLYNKNNYLVVVPKTEESSCFWGLGTEWWECRKKDNMFYTYTNNSPMYICHTPNGKKYIFDTRYIYPRGQDDNPINNIEDPVLRELAFITGKIKLINEINTNSLKECLLGLKNDLIDIKDINRNNLTPEQYEQCCLEACKQDGYSIEDIPRDISNYPECCLEACKINGYAIKYIPKDISNYAECCLESSKINISHVPLDAPNYEECKSLYYKTLEERLSKQYSQQYNQPYKEKYRKMGFTWGGSDKIKKEDYNPNWTEDDVLKNKEFFNKLIIPQVEMKVELTI